MGLLDKSVEITKVIKEQEEYAQECKAQVAYYTNLQEIWPTWLRLQELEREVQRERSSSATDRYFVNNSGSNSRP